MPNWIIGQDGEPELKRLYDRHYTYVRSEAVASRNPGWCFICAGWNRCGYTKAGLHILEKAFSAEMRACSEVVRVMVGKDIEVERR